MSIMFVLSFVFANILKFSINVCLCATEEKNSDQQEADIFFQVSTAQLLCGASNYYYCGCAPADKKILINWFIYILIYSRHIF